MKPYERVFAKIDLDAIAYNLKSIEKKLSPETKIIAVVKADGYGHGAAVIAKEIEESDQVFGFAVATAEEAFSLKRNGIRKPILILGYTFESDYEALIQKQIRFTVYSYDMAEAISKAAGKIGTDAYIHIKIDTGMSRIGYQATEESADEIAEIAALPGIVTEGIFTHFARADEKDKSSAKEQLKIFLSMIDMLKERKVEIPFHHCSNSAGIAELKESHMDLVRAGIILYGLWPSEEIQRDSISLKPVMELKSKIIHIKTLEAGRCVSYGGTYQLKEKRKIATIPVGYADGYPRSLSGKGYVLIHGKKAPILGRICMDQFMVDVSAIPGVTEGDEVTLIGADGREEITMEELGALSGRFNYELACDLGKRIPRVYLKDGEIVCTVDDYGESL